MAAIRAELPFPVHRKPADAESLIGDYRPGNDIYFLNLKVRNAATPVVHVQRYVLTLSAKSCH
jgi:hypothetical protein